MLTHEMKGEMNMSINIETKNGAVIVKELMVTDYNDKEIGTTGFEIGDLLVVHSKDESENYLAVITAVQSYHEDADSYEKFLEGDEEIQEFLNQPEADGSAEWIIENDQYLVCWEEIAEVKKRVVFEDAKSWC